jgi:hypothetical protein
MKNARVPLSNVNVSQNGVMRSMLLDCIELERHVFPALHVTIGFANWLLSMIKHADALAEDAPEALKEARTKQTEAECSHQTMKKETADWETRNGPTLPNMHLAEGCLNDQIEVDGELAQEEREAEILDLVSLKDKIKTFKRESSELKNQKQRLSKLNAAAKAQLLKSRRTLEDAMSLFKEELKALSQKTGTSSGHPGTGDTFSKTNTGS